jgi:hypothetical protein
MPNHRKLRHRRPPWWLILTLTALAALIAAAFTVATARPAHADGLFTMCPSGHEGVIGGHTSCAFAENVSQAFWAAGGTGQLVAYSPVTGARYEMSCEPYNIVHFSTGESLLASQCYGGDGAAVLVW